MKELRLTATQESLNQVNAFVEEFLDAHECPPRAAMQIMVALEELYVNIAIYAYAPAQGEAVVQLDFTEEDRLLRITLIDSGIPFNPLAKDDPDITLSAEERSIGGLGIYMVKKSMDLFTYERKDGMNIVCIGKKI